MYKHEIEYWVNTSDGYDNRTITVETETDNKEEALKLAQSSPSTRRGKDFKVVKTNLMEHLEFDYFGYLKNNPLLKESFGVGDKVILTRDISTRIANFKKGDEMVIIPGNENLPGYKLESSKGQVWGLEPHSDFKLKDENFDKPLKEDHSQDDLFDSWREGELEVGNSTLEDITSPDNLDGDNKVSYEKYVEVINKYPNLNLHDVAAAVSSILFGVGEYEDFDFEELSKDEFNKIEQIINPDTP